MIVYITRFTLVVVGAIGGFAAADAVDWSSEVGFPQDLVILIFVVLGSSIGYLLGGILGRELAWLWSRAEDRVRDIEPVDLLLGTGGLIVGLLVALLVSAPLRLLRPLWLAVVSSALVFVMLAYAGIRIALVKRRDFTRFFSRFFGRESHDEPAAVKAGPLLLDTSAIIDGRFVELVNLGFLQGDLRVPRFVLAELHTLADSADDTKRARGRRGLDLLETLPAKGVAFETFEADYPDLPTVDAKLVRLAPEIGGAVVTVDYNLTKVARVEGVEVLNINELAAGLRPAFLPGEALRVRIVRNGREADQGVGYLEDGTMVVVQHGHEHVGEETDTEVTSVLQTGAGRMIFARVKGRPTEDDL